MQINPKYNTLIKELKNIKTQDISQSSFEKQSFDFKETEFIFRFSNEERARLATKFENIMENISEDFVSKFIDLYTQKMNLMAYKLENNLYDNQLDRFFDYKQLRTGIKRITRHDEKAQKAISQLIELIKDPENRMFLKYFDEKTSFKKNNNLQNFDHFLYETEIPVKNWENLKYLETNFEKSTSQIFTVLLGYLKNPKIQ